MGMHHRFRWFGYGGPPPCPWHGHHWYHGPAYDYPPPPPAPAETWGYRRPPTKADEKEWLTSYIESMKEELAEAEERLREIEGVKRK